MVNCICVRHVYVCCYNHSRLQAVNDGNFCGQQVIVAVALKKQTLRFLESVDLIFVDLAQRCMSHNPFERPRTSEALATLQTLEELYPVPLTDNID